MQTLKKNSAQILIDTVRKKEKAKHNHEVLILKKQHEEELARIKEETALAVEEEIARFKKKIDLVIEGDEKALAIEEEKSLAIEKEKARHEKERALAVEEEKERFEKEKALAIKKMLEYFSDEEVARYVGMWVEDIAKIREEDC